MLPAREGDLVLDLTFIGWGVLCVTGKNRESFLQGLTTVNVIDLPTGSTAWGNILTNKGKLFDYNLFLKSQDAIFLLASEEGKDRLYHYLNRFIFPADEVELKDISNHWTILSFLGSSNNISQIAESSLVFQYHPYTRPRMNAPETDNLLADLINSIRSGFTVITPTLLQTTTESPETRTAFKLLTIILNFIVGNPSINREIQWKEESNVTISSSSAAKILVPKEKKENLRYGPFELGLVDFAVTANKGCYTGQEIMARSTRSLIRAFFKYSIPPNSQEKRDEGKDGYVHAHETVIRNQLIGINPNQTVSMDWSRKGDRILDRSGNEVGVITSNCWEEIKAKIPTDFQKVEEISQISLLIVQYLNQYLSGMQQSAIWRLLSKANEEGHYPMLEMLLQSSIGMISSRCVSNQGQLYVNEKEVSPDRFLNRSLRLYDSQQIQLRKLAFPDFKHIRLLQQISKEVWTEEKKNLEQEAREDISPSNKEAPLMTDEERKRKKMEEIAKKIELMKANRSKG